MTRTLNFAGQKFVDVRVDLLALRKEDFSNSLIDAFKFSFLLHLKINYKTVSGS